MTLKGYEWLRDGKVIMTFTFKRLDLVLWTSVTQEEYDEFCKFLDDKGRTTRYLNMNGHVIEKRVKRAGLKELLESEIGE